MAEKTTFKELVACVSDNGEEHHHELEIASSDEGPYPLSAVARQECEIRYTCPVSGEDRIAVIRYRPNFFRPYRVVSVT
jgi:hypothetical protein